VFILNPKIERGIYHAQIEMGQPEFSKPQLPDYLKPVPNLATAVPHRRLAGKVALLMGSDGRLDRKIASVYTQQGACVVLCGLHLRRGQALAQQLRHAGADARFLLVDAADATDVEMAVAETVATYGHLDILVNNCQPLAQQHATVQTLHPAVWHRTLDASLGGPFLAVHHTLAFLSRTQNSSVINIAPLPDRGPSLANAVSLAGLSRMTHCMAQSLATYGIRVNLIWAGSNQQALRPEGMPIYRLGPANQRPERAITRAALYLACAESQCLSGSTLWVRPITAATN